jgi:hypothetical protein
LAEWETEVFTSVSPPHCIIHFCLSVRRFAADDGSNGKMDSQFIKKLPIDDRVGLEYHHHKISICPARVATSFEVKLS